MKLVIGGAYQGKKEAAKALFGLSDAEIADGETCAFEEIFNCRAIAGFHRYLWRMTEAGLAADALADALASRNPELIIISSEIGCGIVPLDQKERLWREATGRICCELAARAELVVRVTAGVPMAIKGELS